MPSVASSLRSLVNRSTCLSLAGPVCFGLALFLLAVACRDGRNAAGPPPPAAPPPAGCPAFRDLARGLPTSPGWRTNPSLADVNGDGYLDLAATTRKGEQPRVFLFQPPDGWIDSSEGIALDFRPCGVGVDLVDLTGVDDDRIAPMHL